jgi:hypothetical protein
MSIYRSMLGKACLFGLLAVLILTGCASQGMTRSGYLTDYDGMQRQDSKKEEAVAISPESDLSLYSHAMIMPVIYAGKTTDEDEKKDFQKLRINIIKGGHVSFGRNEGAKIAETPYLIFMDADAVLLNRDILSLTYHNLKKYDLITTKQRSTTGKILDNLIWVFFNLIRSMMNESFSTGCYFVISKEKFINLGGFDESVNQSEDFLLSKKIPKKKFKVLHRYIGQDDRRFKKMGYFNFIKLVILNYLNKNNPDWFKKDVGYW